ncbi:DUF1439 domain-containing protein [Ferrimonas senticii]|uniref:DUF1439 domain-containing protein n=1 Tax=Ferrimonas senticii TaxID=394566 RepID=UPI0003FE11A6|nr:DUF1439 domain-containing protein [Ferrimonas senticii]
MKPLRLLVVAASTLLAACSTTYSVTEAELEGYLNQQLRKQHDAVQSKAPLGASFVLGDTSVKIGADSDKVAVTSSARVQLDTPIIPLRAGLSLEFKAKPYYDPVEQAIYLRDVELSTVEASPKQVEALLKPLGQQTSQWLSLILQSQPVYTLDQNDWRQELIGQFGREIKVKPGKLEFILKP